MRELFEALGIFNWVTPAVELKHKAKDTSGIIRKSVKERRLVAGDEFNLYVKSKSYPRALAELKRIGVEPKRKPVGWGIVGEYQVVIPYDKLGSVTSVLDQAGVEYR